MPGTERSVYPLFEECALENAERPAIVFEGKSYSYAWLLARVGHLYDTILAKASSESYIGISTTRTHEKIVGVLAILKAGKAYLPLDPKYPGARLEQMIGNAGLRYVVCSDQEQPFFAAWGLGQIGYHEPAATGASPAVYNPVACVLYTSGSTGVPKGVCLTHKGLVNQLLWQKEHSAAGPGVRSLQFNHLSFDAAFLDIFVPLTTGGCLYLVDDTIRLHAGNLLTFVKDNAIERLFLSYTVMQFLAEVAEVHQQYPASLKEVITGGELLRITPAIARFFGVLKDCTLMNVYGPTETSVWVTELKLKGNAEQWPGIPSLGWPVAGARVFVVDEQLKPVPDGEQGEALICGDCVGQGYLNNPELTAERFIDWQHPDLGMLRGYRTGDIVSVNADGSFQFQGRRDDQVKIRGGYRVELSEIEVVIAQQKGVSQVKVVVNKDIAEAPRILAYVILQDKELTSHEIIKRVAATLPRYMVPDFVVIVDKFPYTTSGKVDKNALPLPRVATRESGEQMAAMTPTERYLQSVWQELLGIGNIGPDSSFFSLGGTSLVAIKLMIRLERDLRRKLPLVSVFEHPTISELAGLIDSNKSEGQFSPLVTLKASGSRIPLYVVHGDNLTVLNFGGMVSHLHPDQPVYGLQPKGLDGSEPIRDIKEMAAYYNRAILNQNPEGPYALAGYSFGGYVALEMATQLRAMGRQVCFLGMFDTQVLNAENSFSRGEQLMRKARRQVPKFRWIAKSFMADAGQAVRYQLAALMGRVRQLYGKKNKSIDGITDFQERMEAVLEAHHSGLKQYSLMKYEGTIVLFKAMERPYYVDDFDYLGWRNYATDVTVFEIPGDHATIFLEPNCQVLASKVGEALSAAMKQRG